MRKTNKYQNYVNKLVCSGKKYYNKFFKRETSIIQDQKDGQANKSAG